MLLGCGRRCAARWRSRRRRCRGVADFFEAVDFALDGGEGQIVDLRVRAPEWAARCGDFELTRQVVEFRIRCQAVRDFQGEGAGVDQLRVPPLHGVEGRRGGGFGDVADHGRRRRLWGWADGGQRVERLPRGRDSMVSQWSWMFWQVVIPSARLRACLSSKIANDAELVRIEQAVGKTNAHHPK